MPIKQTTPQQEVDAYLDREIRKREQALIYTLAYVGEKCVNIARDTRKAAKNYIDQTGNLRSSTGYVIVMDGKIVQASSFNQIKEGEEGATEGLNFAKEVAAKYKRGIVLILVAGRNYAVHVQNKGYDVLDSAELYAESIVPKMIKKLGLQ